MKAPGSIFSLPLAGGLIALVLSPIALGSLEGAPYAIPVFFLTLLAYVLCFFLKRVNDFFSLAALVALGLLFSISHRGVGDDFEIWTFRELAVTMLWAPAVAIFLEQQLRRGKESAVLLGWLAMAAFGTLGALDLARNGAVDALRLQEGIILRDNPNATVIYLGYLEASNVIIGVFPPAVCGAAGLLVGLTQFPRRLKFIFIGLGLLALWPSIYLGTRTLLAAILLLTLPLGVQYVRNQSHRWMAGMALGCLMVTSGGLLYFSREHAVGEMVIRRFSELPEDNRFMAWGDAIAALGQQPFGGGMKYFTTLKWAHNVLLDVGLTAGLPFALLLLAAWAWTLRNYWWLYRKDRVRLFDKVLGLATTLSIVSALTMPPNKGFLALQLLAFFYFIVRRRNETSFHVGVITPERVGPARRPVGGSVTHRA